MRPTPVMFSALASFAHIRAQDIPQGVMPNKRQVIGTGVTSSSSVAPTSSADPSSTIDQSTSQETTPTTPASSTSEPPASNTDDPETSAGPTITGDDTSATSATRTSDTPEEPTADSSSTIDDPNTSEEATGIESSTSSTPTSQSAVITTDSNGSTITSAVSASASGTATSAVRTADDEDGDPVVVIGSSTIDPSTFASKTTITSAVVRQSTEPYTSTTFYTENGTVRSRVVTGDRIVSSTEIATATIDPTLAKSGNGGGGGSSMAPQTKAIIGGVVGGIGGAILIGGLAIVAWRLWGKKKREQAAAVDDFGMGTAGSPRDSLGREKQVSASSHAPTLSTSSYRNPNGAVNTASNF